MTERKTYYLETRLASLAFNRWLAEFITETTGSASCGTRCALTPVERDLAKLLSRRALHLYSPIFIHSYLGRLVTVERFLARRSGLGIGEGPLPRTRPSVFRSTGLRDHLSAFPIDRSRFPC